MTRVNFQTIIAKYRNLGKGNVRLTQSTLFLTKPINPTVTTYNFDVLETQTATLQADELRLNLNDEYTITTMGLYLIASSEVTPKTGTPFVGANTLFTYTPAEQSVSTLNAGNFYNGSLQIAVNNIVYLDKWDTKKHEVRPRTQFANFITPNTASQPSNQFSKDAMFPVEPLIVLSGAKKNQITLSLPNAIGTSSFSLVDNEGGNVRYTINRVGILLRGLNAQNGAVFQS